MKEEMKMSLTRKIDELGRILLPTDLRHDLNFFTGDEIEVTVDGESIRLTKIKQTCFICDSEKDVQQENKALLCGTCRAKLNRMLLT